MKIIAISDLHNHKPEIPACDLLIIAGDLFNGFYHKLRQQPEWLENGYKFWINNLPAKEIIFVPGNHDFMFQENRYAVKDIRWRVLIDDWTIINDLKIYGTPWQKGCWAFGTTEDELIDIMNKIPADTDIIVSHAPPFGCCDNNFGCLQLKYQIEIIQPKLVVCGHVHEAFGQGKIKNTNVYNVAYVDKKYQPKNKPVEIIF